MVLGKACMVTHMYAELKWNIFNSQANLYMDKCKAMQLTIYIAHLDPYGLEHNRYEKRTDYR